MIHVKIRSILETSKRREINMCSNMQSSTFAAPFASFWLPHLVLLQVLTSLISSSAFAECPLSQIYNPSGVSRRSSGLNPTQTPMSIRQTYINIRVQNPETQFSGAVYGAVAVKFLPRRRRKLPCDSHNRKGSLRSGGTIEQLLPHPPHLHVLSHRNFRNIPTASRREQDERAA